MNEYDSELVVSILTNAGYEFTNSIHHADIILLNTCSVRENAHNKVFGHIHAMRHDLLKGDSPHSGTVPIFGILGCMASSMKEKLLYDKSLNLNFIAGPDSYKKLPEILKNIGDSPHAGTVPSSASDFDLSEFETYSDVTPKREQGVNAWIAIMRGCNNFCTFCIVPYARGRERSRSPESIIDETKQLASEGFKQVTLLGQNVNSYCFNGDSPHLGTVPKGTDFCSLVEQVSQVKGIKRVRFTAPHPKDFPEKLIDVMAANEKICKHIHLPLQAGNNRILKLMNRPYTKESYLELVDKIKKKIPDMAITTDIIAGFPTETDEEFEDTVDVMKKVEFNSSFIFQYSVREGTAAARNFEDDVSEQKKSERTVRLNETQKDISLKRNSLHIGKEELVLIEDVDKKSARGRNDNNISVSIEGGGPKIGDIVKVRIESATPHVLKARID